MCVFSLTWIFLSAGEYTRPFILPRGSGLLRLCDARHPCVELMDDMQFISNSYDLKKGESNFQIITGPNMVARNLIHSMKNILFLNIFFVVGWQVHLYSRPREHRGARTNRYTVVVVVNSFIFCLFWF
jgi:hypothetical protein